MWVITETVTLGNPSLGLVHLVDQDDVSGPNAASSPGEWYRITVNDLILNDKGVYFIFGGSKREPLMDKRHLKEIISFL